MAAAAAAAAARRREERREEEGGAVDLEEESVGEGRRGGRAAAGAAGAAGAAVAEAVGGRACIEDGEILVEFLGVEAALVALFPASLRDCIVKPSGYG